MTQYGPAAFRKSVENRTADRQQGVARKVRALLDAIDKLEGVSVKIASRTQQATVKVGVPEDAWQGVLRAAKALKGV